MREIGYSLFAQALLLKQYIKYYDMFELIYYSSANPNLSADDLTDILETARDYNSKNKITGFLLYHNHEFIQILEGDKKIVEELFSNISSDGRHSDIRLVSKGSIEKREFGAWKMGYHQLSDENRIEAGKKLFITNFIALSELVEKPTKAKKLFWYMSKELLHE